MPTMTSSEFKNVMHDRGILLEEQYFTDGKNATPEPGKAAARAQWPTWPTGTPLDAYLEYAREFSEAPDKVLIGAILPVLAATLGRRVSMSFGGNLYPNLFSLIAAPPGFRKSTTIGLVEHIARNLLRSESFTSSIASEEALFTEYEADPDKLLIEDEGNAIVSNWSNTSYGKTVAKRYLKLFDCKPFQVSFMKNLKAAETTVKIVPETSTSVVLGATLNVADFQGLESADGLRRRFLTYLYDDTARTIYFPRGFDDKELEWIARGFSGLLNFSKRMTFSGCGRTAFMKIQDRNREKVAAGDLGDAARSLLAGEAAFILKLAMVFAALRAISANSTNSTGGDITAEILGFAEAHMQERLHDATSLHSNAQKAAIAGEAGNLLEIVQADFRKESEGSDAIILSQSAITRKFCPNPSRDRAYRDSLYKLIIPYLISKGHCREIATPGKGRTFAFRACGGTC